MACMCLQLYVMENLTKLEDIVCILPLLEIKDSIAQIVFTFTQVFRSKSNLESAEIFVFRK